MDLSTLNSSLANVNNCQKDNYLLEETDSSATLRKVKLVNIPIGSLIIKMDKTKFDNFFKGSTRWGYNKHCDFILITSDKVIFIELKSKKEVGKDLISDCIIKFSSDLSTLSYADEIFVNMLNKNKLFSNKSKHYVLIYQKLPLAKTVTSIQIDKNPNNTPHTFRRISVLNEGTISFDQIY